MVLLQDHADPDHRLARLARSKQNSGRGQFGHHWVAWLLAPVFGSREDLDLAHALPTARGSRRGGRAHIEERIATREHGAVPAEASRPPGVAGERRAACHLGRCAGDSAGVPGPALPRALRAAGGIHGGLAKADVPTLRRAQEGSRAASLADAGGYQRGPLRSGGSGRPEAFTPVLT